MEPFVFNLLAEPRTRDNYLLQKTRVTVKGNRNGLFVNENKVSDVFFNGIQLRLYVLGDSDAQKKEMLDKNFYLIFSENENELGFSFKELKEILEAVFILTP